ncbi:AAA family ATPase [Sinorhizobium meliloti]|nr:AAA family ATPase [Sinorhizobium meliloti]MDW9664662.1 AAA family ATPase [Sinorhizobium meliloti]MDX0054313.1 AAA family ATPase [Sinorhizobium meliloti]
MPELIRGVLPTRSRRRRNLGRGVIAGLGTGKSFAMKRRVARLLESGGAPDEILAITFTRVPAENLYRELQKLATPGCEELQGPILDGLAMRILPQKHVLEVVSTLPVH